MNIQRVRTAVFGLLLTLLTAYCLPSALWAANRMWWATCTTGGGDCLDGIDGASLTPGDGAIVVQVVSGTATVFTYGLAGYASDPPSTSDPQVIAPATNPGNLRWMLGMTVFSATSLIDLTGLNPGNTKPCSISGTPSAAEGACVINSADGYRPYFGDGTNANGTAMLVAKGTATMGTAEIISGVCDTVVTVSAPGVATTDVVLASFNGDPTGVTGYAPSASGILTIIVYPTAGYVNFKVCNLTAAAITPGSAITLNWRVDR